MSQPPNAADETKDIFSALGFSGNLLFLLIWVKCSGRFIYCKINTDKN